MGDGLVCLQNCGGDGREREEDLKLFGVCVRGSGLFQFLILTASHLATCPEGGGDGVGRVGKGGGKGGRGVWVRGKWGDMGLGGGTLYVEYHWEGLF